MIRGIEFGVGNYERDDVEYANPNLDWANLMHIELPPIGRREGSCIQFNIDPTDYITEITVKHSPDAINALEFKTNDGKTHKIGSDQPDNNNEFNWEVTTVEFADNERLLGAYANVKGINGEIRLRSIGFFKSSCSLAPVVMVKELKPVHPKDPKINRPVIEGSKLKGLPDLSTLKTTDVRSFDSTTGSPDRKRMEHMGVAVLILIVLLSSCICCVAAYCVCKNRGKCFKKLSTSGGNQGMT